MQTERKRKSYYDGARADDSMRKRARSDSDSNQSVSSAGQGKILKQLTYDDYVVGWICALPIEMTAARAVLDEEHESLPSLAGDDNIYTLGAIFRHNVVIACLRDGVYGTTSATAVAKDMLRTYPNSKSIPLMIGIGGGVPNASRDMRLGDVVVGVPTSEGPAVTQYDRGKTIDGGISEPKGQLNKPAPLLLSAVAKIETEQEMRPNVHASYISEALERHQLEAYAYPGHEPNTTYAIQDDAGSRIHRAVDVSRRNDNPVIHYGTIGSGNQVMKHAPTRDRIAQPLQIICFEMEAAGLMDHLPCLVIRGICDYCDGHKSKHYQRYAALAAAAYGKYLLSVIPMIQREIELEEIRMGKEQAKRNRSKDLARFAKESRLDVGEQPKEQHRDNLMKALKFDLAETRLATVRQAHARTCDWIIQHRAFQNWLNLNCGQQSSAFLWIKGHPGTGKSTIMRFILNNLEKEKTFVTISFFFNARGQDLEKSTIGMYRSLVYQLINKMAELRPLLDEFGSATKFGQDSCRTLEDLFRRAIERLRSTAVICVIDALDECPEDQIREMVRIFEGFGKGSVHDTARFHVLFSSRHYPNVSISSGASMDLEDEQGHSEDIVNYIDAELRIGKTKLAESVKQEIFDLSKGVFLWVVLTAKILNAEYDRGRLHSLKRKLKEIPTELNDLFREIFLRDERGISDLSRCLKLVLYARRPLRREECYFAMLSTDSSVDIVEWHPSDIPYAVMDKFILDCSRGLLEVTRGSGPRVQFIHETVREFLLQRAASSGWSLHDISGISDIEGHILLRDCCVTYINACQQSGLRIPEGFPSTECSDSWFHRADLSRYPFLAYAVSHVLLHAEQAQALEVSQAQFIDEFPLSSWIRLRKIAEQEMLQELGSFWDLENIFITLGLNSMFAERLRFVRPLKSDLEVLVSTSVAAHNFEACREIVSWYRNKLIDTKKRSDDVLEYTRIFFNLLTDAKSTGNSSTRRAIVRTLLAWPLNPDAASSYLQTLEFALRAKRPDALLLLFSSENLPPGLDFARLQARLCSIPPLSRHSNCYDKHCLASHDGNMASASYILSKDTITCIEILDSVGQPLGFVSNASTMLSAMSTWADGLVIQYLIDKGANANAVIDDGTSVLGIARHRGDQVAIKALLEGGARDEEEIKTRSEENEISIQITLIP